ncbi:hypothetical protein SBOR_5369 [Sclerotinia borealis F-4128]|uniref:Uncharacterized protein n=1 Tax=Sclerotinia borealis (strain F-4128) TaxID=1432307 RepID=W9CI70_SCLBF|nr:hypothetical protein SBOR_5369 [Sclerotinia borealis F-4128]
MSFGPLLQEIHCRYRINSKAETIFYFIDSGGKTTNPRATGFLAQKCRYNTPHFGTQAFADFISSAWPTQADDRPDLLRLYVNIRSAAVDYIEGDRIWSIDVHKMRHDGIRMWKAYSLAQWHTPTLNIRDLDHDEIILLLHHIPAHAVGMDITHTFIFQEALEEACEESDEGGFLT